MQKHKELSISQTSALTASTAASEGTLNSEALLMYEDPAVLPKQSKFKAPVISPVRRGGVLFKDNSQYQLQPVKYAEAKRGILKVASLEDSLRSCLPKKKDNDVQSRRSSFSFESLTSSLNSLLSAEAQTSTERECASLSAGMDMAESANLPTGDSSSSSLSSQTPALKGVHFSEIHCRQYPVAPDDNPSVSGNGPAIALSGWNYTTQPPVAVEEYESTRGPRRAMEDLKLDMMERRKRLLYHGATQEELREFGRRVQKARARRLETVQAAKIYGKKHEQREERRAKVRRFIQRTFGLRKTVSKEQRALWDQAQQLPQPRKEIMAATPTKALTA